jgi:hypothetical protein
MPFLKEYQHHIKRKDVATVGRLGGGYPVPASDWYQDSYGVGFTGVGNYSGSDMDATSSQGMDSDDAGNSGAAATGATTGGTAGSM